jgi:hypothetical protein
MDQSKSHSAHANADRQETTYQAPTIEVIALDCEISAYAPDDGDIPLF